MWTCRLSSALKLVLQSSHLNADEVAEREEDEAFDEEDAVNPAEYFVDECLEDDDAAAAASAFADERLRRFPGEWTRISGSGSSA